MYLKGLIAAAFGSFDLLRLISVLAPSLHVYRESTDSLMILTS